MLEIHRLSIRRGVVAWHHSFEDCTVVPGRPDRLLRAGVPILRTGPGQCIPHGNIWTVGMNTPEAARGDGAASSGSLVRCASDNDRGPIRQGRVGRENV